MSAEIELLNIPVTEIEFGTRARKAYKDLEGLAISIKEKGLIHPVAVQRTPDSNKPFLLLAGGRRYSAVVFNDMKTIPTRVYPNELSELDRREIELMENIQSEDLEWTEKVWLTTQIHELQTEKHGEAMGPSEGHSANDTAKLLGVSGMTVSRDRKLAQGLEKHGEALSIAKNESEALRTLKKLERIEKNEEAAHRFEEELRDDKGENRKKSLVNGYILGDFFEGVRQVPDNAVAFVEVDPPYAIDIKAKKFARAAFQEDDLSWQQRENPLLDVYNEIDEAVYPEFLTKLFKECYRVMHPGSWIIAWHAHQWKEQVINELTEAGFAPCSIPALWAKSTPGQCLNPSRRLANSYESFIYASKDDGIIHQPGTANVFQFTPISPEKKSHPTERPIEMMERLLDVFCRPGAHIMVPFLGSGNTMLAAANKGTSAFGFDLAEDYRNAFVARVQTKMPGEYKSYE